MVTMDDVRKWKPLTTMENATEAIYRQRVQDSMDVVLPHFHLVLIPYVGLVAEVVEYATDELISLCPVTFLPDINKLRIRYVPRKSVPELKALKFYLLDYRELPISHEHLAAKIYQDFHSVVGPDDLSVDIEVAIRGGITTKIHVGSKI